MTRPDFFIVGAPKCGTTSLAHWLTEHPDLFVVRGEPHFFGSDIEYNRPRIDEPRYRRLWRNAGPDSRVGERSTWYLYSETAADEIHRWNPAARIIALLRDPVDMIHSLHAHAVLRGGREDRALLADALALEPARRAGDAIPVRARFPQSLFYRAVPRYAEQLERYLRRFGRDQVHVVLFEDLCKDPRRVYTDVLDFLGVDRVERSDFEVHNRRGSRPDDWLHRLWKRGTLRYTIRRLAPEPLYRWLRARGVQTRWRSSPRARPVGLSTVQKAALRREFAPEVRRLEALLGRRLPGWAASGERSLATERDRAGVG